MLCIHAIALLLCMPVYSCELDPVDPDRKPIAEAKAALVAWIEDIGAAKFIEKVEGKASFLPVEDWEIGIDGERDNETGAVTLGVYYPYRDEETGRTLKDLVGVVLEKADGEWSVAEILH